MDIVIPSNFPVDNGTIARIITGNVTNCARKSYFHFKGWYFWSIGENETSFGQLDTKHLTTDSADTKKNIATIPAG